MVPADPAAGDRRPVGFEALARWQRPTGQIERPGAFIGLAEETGLMTKLDLAVMAQAMQDLAAGASRGRSSG